MTDPMSIEHRQAVFNGGVMFTTPFLDISHRNEQIAQVFVVF
jgi:hypothetical protein